MNTIGPVRRTWGGNTDDDPTSCYLPMSGRVTLGELIDYLHANHPEVKNTRVVELNFATATWQEPPTAEEMAKRQAWWESKAQKQEDWERRTYERLKAKYE